MKLCAFVDTNLQIMNYIFNDANYYYIFIHISNRLKQVLQIREKKKKISKKILFMELSTGFNCGKVFIEYFEKKRHI